MSSRQVRVTSIAIARRALSVRCALRQPVHIVFRLNPKIQSKNFLSRLASTPVLQVAARHPDMFSCL